MYACLYRPPAPDGVTGHRGERGDRSDTDLPASTAAFAGSAVAAIAEQFSPRFECRGGDLVWIDVSGLDRLIGPPQTIGEELRREAAARGVRVHVAVAFTRTAAAVLAIARPGVTIVARGEEAGSLAPIAIGMLEKVCDGGDGTQSTQSSQNAQRSQNDVVEKHSECSAVSAVSAFGRWGLKTLGELAALPAADLAARLGKPALALQAIARGEDVRPLVPTLADERFDASLDLEWPIEELEPLSFVLTRLLEPLSLRLERRDRGAAVLHVLLRLVTRDTVARRLELPSPIRDVRTLRTLALLDLESHPPGGGVDRVTIVIDPTPGRVLQHTLFTRAHPTPEQLSTLAARLGALMGTDRFGAPAAVDSYRPGAFAMAAFKTDHETVGLTGRGERGERGEKDAAARAADSARSAFTIVSALRRCRQPVPARVAIVDGQPARVVTDRRGFAGGAVLRAAGPWRTSGAWWTDRAAHLSSWNRDEWDVWLSDGAVYRIFRDRESDAWFIDAVVD